MASLEREYKYFKAHQDELVEKYGGKFIVIVDDEVVAAYENELEAYTEMKRQVWVRSFPVAGMPSAGPAAAISLEGCLFLGDGPFNACLGVYDKVESDSSSAGTALPHPRYRSTPRRSARPWTG